MTKPLEEMSLEELWQLFPIILTEHDPAWKTYYAEEVRLLTEFLGDDIFRIRHIGSTAVDGLLAKPTVDILLEIKPEAPIENIKTSLISCDYIIMAETQKPDYRLDLCKGYTPQGFADKVFHLHLRFPGDWDEPVFCEYLKNNPLKAQEYARLKKGLQKQFKHNRDAYTDAKGDFIRACVAAAREQK